MKLWIVIGVWWNDVNDREIWVEGIFSSLERAQELTCSSGEGDWHLNPLGEWGLNLPSGSIFEAGSLEIQEFELDRRVAEPGYL